MEQHASGHESDDGTRHKRHKRDRDSYRGDLEDGEFGDDVDRW